MHRVRGADDAGADATALRCVPAQEAFLCDRRLGDPNELFVCELTDAGPGSLTKAMDACVWPVCEQICASRPPGAERADDWEMTRARQCGRACHAKGFRPETSAGKTPRAGGSACGSPRTTRGGTRRRARARVRVRARRGTGGGPGSPRRRRGHHHAAPPRRCIRHRRNRRRRIDHRRRDRRRRRDRPAAASTAAVATTAALTATSSSSRRAALLFMAFKSVSTLSSSRCRVRLEPRPEPTGRAPEPRHAPRLASIPPAPTWRRRRTRGRRRPRLRLSPPPPPPATSTSPPPPPAPNPGGQCPGVTDPAFSCVGECGLCIYFPGEEDPNCCCDADCSSFGDCCGDFDACCPAGTFAAKHAFDASALGKKSVFSGARRGSSFGGVRTVSGSPFDGVRTVSGSPSGATGRDARPRTAGDEAAQLSTRGATVGARRAKEGGHARVAARSARILDLD